MGSNTGNDVQRSSATIQADSEVEIYLDTKVLSKEIDEYKDLKKTLTDWEKAIQSNITKTANSSSGNSTDAYKVSDEEFLAGDFSELCKKTNSAISTMNKVYYAANKLLQRCENFYEILLGQGEYQGDESLPSAGVADVTTGTSLPTTTTELFLDITYYGGGGGELSTNTENAVLHFTTISDKVDILSGYLEKLEYKSIEYLQDCSLIEEDCNNKERLNILYQSFTKYVDGVNKLNTTAVDEFDTIAESYYVYDYTRTYEYSGYKPETDNAVLQRVLRSELHEMGLTDEEIDNAITKSSFTLSSLASCVESICAEDNLENAYNTKKIGDEVALLKCVLSGDALNGYNTYGYNLSDKASMCWYTIAKYQMGLVHTMYSDEERDFSDLGYKDYINEMNAVLMSVNSNRVLGALKSAAFMEVLNSSSMYESQKTGPYAEVLGENYRKNMLLYDTYIFIDQKIQTDEKWYDKFTTTDRKYQISSMQYDNAGFHLTVQSQEYAERYNRYYPVAYFNDKDSFKMDITYYVGDEGVSAAFADGADSKKVIDATKEVGKSLEKLCKDSLVFASSAAGPAGPTVMGILLRLNEGATAADYKFIYDKSSGEAINFCYKYGSPSSSWSEDKAKFSTVHNGVATGAFDIYTVLSKSALVGEAEKTVDSNYFARLGGSAGRCTVSGSGLQNNQYFAVTHAGLYTPGYENSFSEILTKPQDEGDIHGIRALCDWDENTTEKVKANIAEKYSIEPPKQNATKSEIKEYEKEKEYNEKKVEALYSLIDGGYDPRIEADVEEYNKDIQYGYLQGEDEAAKQADEMNDKIESIDYSQLYDYLNEINDSYNAIAPDSSVDSVPGREVFDGWGKDVDKLID